MHIKKHILFLFLIILIIGSSCNRSNNESLNAKPQVFPKGISEPLITDIFTADPSTHVFEGKIYIYPSHDVDTGVPNDLTGSHYDMKDYHVFSMEQPGAPVVDHGEVLNITDVSWAKRQMWAPDAAERNGKYYLYFPAKDTSDIFRIGVAVSDQPSGPFTPTAAPIKGAYSIDPSVFKDDDGSYYMYFGGIKGGQLQNWQTGVYDPEGALPIDNEPALLPKIAKLSDSMLEFDEEIREIEILDENGKLLLAGDNNRRFFEGIWMHKYQGKYYLSYSTGTTHKIVYATGDNPYGPFTYQGIILLPVIGWTNHQSIIQFDDKWYLFYHDSSLSGGLSKLRCVKMTELIYNPDGTIKTIDAYIRDENG
jgi:hypothetical protein